MTTYSHKYRQTRQAILKRDDYTCYYCGQEANQVDHIIPIAKGGTHDEQNMVTSCYKCNASKADKPVQQWMEKQSSKRFFDGASSPIDSLVSKSPRDFGVFLPPLKGF